VVPALMMTVRWLRGPVLTTMFMSCHMKSHQRGGRVRVEHRNGVGSLFPGVLVLLETGNPWCYLRGLAILDPSGSDVIWSMIPRASVC
jgi:hypothetical protein